MKKLPVITALLLAGALAAWYFREPLGDLAAAYQTRDMFVTAEAATMTLGPATGSHFPGLQASYQGRRITLVQEFAGSNGTVLVALRSLDWCVYCKRQLVQLNEYKPFFDAAGIALVVITYDPPPVQQAFQREHGIDIPLLSDEQSLSFRTLGILNEDFQPGDSEYGIPHPGLIVIDDEGVVAGKLFVESPEQRVDSKAALRYARRALGLKSPFALR
ncbi:MAG: hypothetical protein CME59_12660 [Halioglobus sp.]|nr:hypothetical protein [Halioglobus sp.]|tara:strand:- start:1281 stop:1931 length:651 start_codon:yes stop_codon:yes gene_type:complete